MNEAIRNRIRKDIWWFIAMGSFLSSTFFVLIERKVQIERMPFRYYLLAAAASLAVETVLYFTIRNWSKPGKIGVVCLIVLVWLGVCLMRV